MTIPFDLQIKTPVGRIGARVRLPERLRLGELAWSVLRLDEQLVAQAVRYDLREGNKSTSCHKGCSACCRQIVPLSPPEAFMIADVSVRMTDALSKITGELFGNEATAVPLVAAVEWALEHREEGQRQFESVPLMTRLVEILHEDIQSTKGIRVE